MTTPPSASELDRAAQLARSGNRAEALEVVRQVLRQDPRNTQALLWFAGLTPSPEEGIAALEWLLQLVPQHQAAAKGLAELRARQQVPAEPRPTRLQRIAPAKAAAPAEAPAAVPPAETTVRGSQIMTLAGSAMWPFRQLNRPLAALLAEGLLGQHDLHWALRNAQDSTLKWAAAVHLAASQVKAAAMTPLEAGQVVWPYHQLNRPLGELLGAGMVTLHDLAWALAEARDPIIREAAAVLGAEMVRRTPAAAKPPTAEAARVAEAAAAEAAAEAAAAAAAETAPAAEAPTAAEIPPPEPAPVAVAPPIPGERLHVVGGSGDPRQVERRRRPRVLLGFVGMALCMLVGLAGLATFLLAEVPWVESLELPEMPVLIVSGVALALVPAFWVLTRRLRRYTADQKGEERSVQWLEQNLDGRWTLFRNVVLPEGKGDIDAVLLGPLGAFALEIKAYSGENRNAGQSWHRRTPSGWQALEENPSQQAQDKAAGLGRLLREHGIGLWVEPRVVWAGRKSLLLHEPAVPVWLLDTPESIERDLAMGRLASDEQITGAIAALEGLRLPPPGTD